MARPSFLPLRTGSVAESISLMNLCRGPRMRLRELRSDPADPLHNKHRLPDR
jgi:hypothetical protein